MVSASRKVDGTTNSGILITILFRISWKARLKILFCSFLRFRYNADDYDYLKNKILLVCSV